MRTRSRLAALLPIALLMTGALPAHSRAAEPPPPAARLAAEAAQGLLAAFRPPPGAVRLPCPAAKVLASAPERPAVVNLVTRTGYWRAPGGPLAALGWIQRHRPDGLAWTGGGEITEGRAVVDIAEFSATGRTLVVSVARAAGGAAIRVDAQVTWLPARPAGERVPAGARVLTVEYLPGSGPVEEITDPAVVHRVAAAADALPLAATGLANCPADFGRRVRLTFRAAPPAVPRAAVPWAGRPLAVLVAQLGGCGIVTMTVGVREYPALGEASALVDALPGRPLGGGRLVHDVRRTAQRKSAGILRRTLD